MTMISRLKQPLEEANITYETAVLLAGLLPICLAIKVNNRVHSRRGTGINNAIRREKRQRSIKEWQSTWDAATAKERASRYARVPPIPGNFWSRVFFPREHLCGMKLTLSPDRTHCPGVAESTEHAMFECPRFDSTRNVRISRYNGRLTRYVVGWY